MTHPTIIQGGMGAGVSSWQLARTVASHGQLGVVSGTALDLSLARKLQVGDPGGHYRRALQHFPIPEITQRVLDRFFIEGGKAPEQPFKTIPLYSATPTQAQLELVVLANFAEVFLAKEGHDGVVGINYLEKIQMPNLPSLYGAILAGVDYVLVGAGIPWEFPGILDHLSRYEEATMKLNVDGAGPDENFIMRFNPQNGFVPPGAPPLRRPKFLGIISSATIAQAMLKRATGTIEGFVVEGPTAGGHNAPPRGQLKLSETGEPIYGPRDEVDFEKMRAFERPFWIAGSYGSPQGLQRALSLGAQGIQVGTAFAMSRESGLLPELRIALLQKAREGTGSVYTDPVASPTGFPFKVARLEGTVSEEEVYLQRPRICDLGYLRSAYRKADGTVGYRCPSEPVEDYLRKGGAQQDTIGRKCLCNGLMANIGLPQHQRTGYTERPLLTAGDDLVKLAELAGEDLDYSAVDVIEYLLGNRTTFRVNGTALTLSGTTADQI